LVGEKRNPVVLEVPSDPAERNPAEQRSVVHMVIGAPAATPREPREAVIHKRGAAVHERILDAAGDLFYAQGLRAVSAEKIIERAGITKVTFYRHFPTKDALIVAYLEHRAELERAGLAVARAAAGDDPVKALQQLAEGIGSESCQPGFRGCAFINAAAEYADPGHPVRRVVAAHRTWFRQELAAMLTDAGVADVDAAVDEIVMLRDGALVCGYLGAPGSVASALAQGFESIIRRHR
jgi:AcrR family transcriptional regulator